MTSERKEISILVVDDEEGIRRNLRRYLERLGYEVTVAADGHQGLAELRKCAFDLAFVDFAMPRMTGIELIQRMRTNYPNVIPIGMSGYWKSLDLEACSLDDRSFVRKPFTLAEISEVLEHYLTK